MSRQLPREIQENKANCTVLNLYFWTLLERRVKALCYKPQGRGFETRWGERIFSIYLIFPATLGPGVYSVSNRNEYQKHKNHVSGEGSDRCIGLTTSPPSVCRLSTQCGILNIPQPYRPPQPVTGIVLLERQSLVRNRDQATWKTRVWSTHFCGHFSVLIRRNVLHPSSRWKYKSNKNATNSKHSVCWDDPYPLRTFAQIRVVLCVGPRITPNTAMTVTLVSVQSGLRARSEKTSVACFRELPHSPQKGLGKIMINLSKGGGRMHYDCPVLRSCPGARVHWVI
jgi:hypothetical protein